ncbi:MAG: plasmid mobilization relaxosome protein MobC [Rickettsiales bacterium]|nr:plasmid mobilization relaxosome protein MobC [Rickettsiales bacterium]
MVKKANLKVRVSEEIKTKLDRFCAKNKIKLSPYIRSIIEQSNNKEIKIITPQEIEVFSNIAYELQQIGTNINQISHYFNLEHLKLLDNDISKIEDLLMIDKCKKEQLDDIRNVLNILKSMENDLINKLSDYDKK